MSALTRRQDLVSFDGGVAASVTMRRPDRYRHLLHVPGADVSIPRGAGLSYAAASFFSNGISVEHGAFNRALELDVPVGFPLQSHSTSHTAVGSDTLRAETRSIVLMFRTEVIDTTTFDVPHSYRITEMSRLMQTRTRPLSPATRPP